MYIDVETTGLAYPAAGLVQLSGAVEIGGVLQETFDLCIAPFPGDVIEEQALEVNGLTKQIILEYSAPAEAYGAFTTLLRKYVDPYDRSDKFHFVGYNAHFDAEHLRAWFQKNGDRFFGSWFWHPPLDVMNLAATLMIGRRHTLPNFKLPTVAGSLGIEVDTKRTHDALYDVELTRLVFQRLQTLQKSVTA